MLLEGHLLLLQRQPSAGGLLAALGDRFPTTSLLNLQQQMIPDDQHYASGSMRSSSSSSSRFTATSFLDLLPQTARRHKTTAFEVADTSIAPAHSVPPPGFSFSARFEGQESAKTDQQTGQPLYALPPPLAAACTCSPWDAKVVSQVLMGPMGLAMGFLFYIACCRKDDGDSSDSGGSGSD